jgi:cyclohexadienyl dehydratase
LRAVHLALPGLTAPALEQQWFALAAARLQGLLTEPECRVLLRALAALRRERGPALARIRASGVLRVGTTGDYAPFSAEQAGALHGADIGLAVELAAHLGVEPVFVRTRWSTLVADLAQDRYDVALSGISVTPDRQRVALFSRTYHQGGKTPIARCADRDRFDTLAEINAPGVRVIVNPGGTNERYAREHLNAADVRVHPDNRSVFDEIVAGRADVMITDDVEVELQTRRHPDLCRTMPGTLTQARKAILMRRDRALREAIDRWMRRQIDAGVPSRLIEGAMQTGAHSWPPTRPSPQVAAISWRSG